MASELLLQSQQCIESRLNSVDKNVDTHLNKLENVLLVESFNATIDGSSMKTFVRHMSLFIYLFIFLSESILLENPQDPGSIDLTLTNRS